MRAEGRRTEQLRLCRVDSARGSTSTSMELFWSSRVSSEHETRLSRVEHDARWLRVSCRELSSNQQSSVISSGLGEQGTAREARKAGREADDGRSGGCSR